MVFSEPNVGVHHLQHFRLDLLTTGNIETQVDSEYIHGLDWYGRLLEVLADDITASTVQTNMASHPPHEDYCAEPFMIFHME